MLRYFSLDILIIVIFLRFFIPEFGSLKIIYSLATSTEHLSTKVPSKVETYTRTEVRP